MGSQLSPVRTASSFSGPFSTPMPLPPQHSDLPPLHSSSMKLWTLTMVRLPSKKLLDRLHPWTKLCVRGYFTGHLDQLWWVTQTL